MYTVTVTRVREALEEVSRGLDAWFDEPERRLRRRGERPGAWTLAEHLEHVALANHFLLLTIGKGCRSALRRAGRMPVTGAESDLERLDAIARPGAFPWEPPGHMVPTGRVDLPQLRRRLKDQQAACLELLAQMAAGEGSLCRIRISVQELGKLDLYQWLFFLAQHGRYHLALMGQDLHERGAPGGE